MTKPAPAQPAPAPPARRHPRFTFDLFTAPRAPTPLVPVAELDALVERVQDLASMAKCELDAARTALLQAQCTVSALHGRHEALSAMLASLRRLHALEPHAAPAPAADPPQPTAA